ncbi:MAG: hypothetical protein ACI9LY_002878 [Arenicella sp.]|jgi:hypothetical protein
MHFSGSPWLLHFLSPVVCWFTGRLNQINREHLYSEYPFMSSNSKQSEQPHRPVQESPEKLAKVQFWNRVQLILILVVFAAPIAGAFLYKSSDFTNYGDLYTPARTVDNLFMQGADSTVQMDSLRRQWVFLVTADSDCSKACEDNILKMRQLRFMQNNNMTRIRALFLHTGLTREMAANLAAKYSPIEAFSAAADDYRDWIKVLQLPDAPVEAQLNRFYIIDPTGNLMMSYPASADPNIMKKDIKRLLKASQIG